MRSPHRAEPFLAAVVVVSASSRSRVVAILPESLSSILHRQEDSRRALFQTYVDLRRQAENSDDYELHRLAADAYTAYMRAHLGGDQRRFLELEDELIRTRAELQRWRSGLERRES